MKLRLLALASSLVSGLLTRAAAATDEPPAGTVSRLSGRDLAGWYRHLGDVKPALGAGGFHLGSSHLKFAAFGFRRFSFPTHS
jgi:hypothetical protein